MNVIKGFKMRQKYKYSIVVFNRAEKLELGVKAEFFSLTLAKKYKKEYSLVLHKYFYCRILKGEITPKIKRNWVDYRKNLVLINFLKVHPCPKNNDMYIEMFPWWYPKHSFMVGA